MAATLNTRLMAKHIDQDLNLPAPGDEIDHLEDGDSDDEDRYELWTIRVPSTMKISDLDGVQFDMDAVTNSKTADGMKINDGKFVISLGETVENENYRVLVPKKKTDADNDDDGDSSVDSEDSRKKLADNLSKYLLRPSSKAFAKHFNVESNLVAKKTEAQLAPLDGPEPVDDVLRHAYSHIPQRKGLKRRWMPLGAPQSSQDVPETLITLQPGKQTPSIPSNNNDAQEPKAKTSRKRSNSSSSQSKKKKRSSETNSNDPDAAAIGTPKKKRIKKEKDTEKKSTKKSSKKSKKRKSVE
jgi:hypothetical protein